MTPWRGRIPLDDRALAPAKDEKTVNQIHFVFFSLLFLWFPVAVVVVFSFSKVCTFVFPRIFNFS